MESSNCEEKLLNCNSPNKTSTTENNCENINNSPVSCVSYEEVDNSFDENETIDILLKMGGESVSAFNSKMNRRSSVSGRRSSSRKSLNKISTKQIKKSLNKLAAPTKSTMEKQRVKLVDEENIFGSSFRNSVQLTSATSTHLTSKSLTKPMSPNLRITKRIPLTSKSVVLTSEEIQFNKIEKDKQEEELRIKKFRKQYLSIKGSAKSTVIAPSTKTLTVPKTPESHVNKRQQAKMAEKGIVATAKPKGIVKKVALKPYVMPNKPTVSAPFKFAATQRAADKTKPSKTPVKSSAELMQKFFQNPRSTYVPVNAATRLTVSEAPKLRTAMRSKGNKTKLLSAQEKEELDMKQIQSHPFKALQLNRKIFDSMGEMGVPKVEAKPCTETVGFELRSDKRASIQRIGGKNPIVAAGDHVTPAKPAFKARPMPSFIKEAPATPAVKTFQPTIGVSPKMRGTQHASSAPSRRQLPHHSVVEQEKREMETRQRAAQNKPKCTEPKAFELRTAARGSVYREQLLEQLQKELDEEAAAREVKVMPVPELKPFQPVITHKEPTEHQPFNLRSVARHDEAQSAFQQELEREEERIRQELFKARPVPKTTYEHHFEVVEKNHDRAPLKTLPVTLTTDLRAKKRQEFDQSIQQKMAELEKMQQTLTKQKSERENLMVKDLRRKSVAEGGLCFKAQPIQVQDLYPAPAHTPKTLTEPKSPGLRTAQRASKSLGNITNTSHQSAGTGVNDKIAAALRNF